MAVKRVLIIHGWGNRRPAHHWHRNLANELRRTGNVVAYPQLPNTDSPVLSDWLDVVAVELDMLGEIGTGELVVIGHSLGCLTWLHAVKAKLVSEIADRVLLVAPADPDLCGEAATFQLDLHDEDLRAAVHAAAGKTLLVSSEADPWLPRGLSETFARPLQLPLHIIHGARHFALEDNWTPWQGVINWVNNPHADLDER